MPLYEFECNCGERFEKIKPMSECADDVLCSCGKMAARVMSTFIDIWPWILTEKSHHKGAKDQWVKDKSSNDPIVDNTKAPYEKTLF